MIVPYNMEDYELVSWKTICSFHQLHPDLVYAGCYCGFTSCMQKKDIDKKPTKFIDIDLKSFVMVKRL